MPETPRQSTLSVRGGEGRRRLAHAVATPIVQSATFAFEDSAGVRAFQLEVEKSRFEYGRYGSPTQLILEKKLAAIYNAQDALVTSSGMSAVTDTFLALLRSGDHLVLTSECYKKTRVFCEDYLAKFGVRLSFVEPVAESIIRAIGKRTRAVFVEIPTNPHLYVPDIPRIASVTRARRIPLLVDPTLAGPFSTDPFRMGADLVILSLTKYLAGHNDVIGGAVLGRKKLLDPVREYHGTAGTLLPPLAAYLVLRGIKTAALRMHRQHDTAEKVARFLEQHPKVRRVYYPGLPSHPHFGVASRLLRGCGGVVTFRLKSDLEGAERFMDRLRLFAIAPSLGGVESLAELPATMSYWDRPRKVRRSLDISDDLVRLSVGIEDAEDLLSDLKQALSAV